MRECIYIAGIENPQALEVEKWLTERGYQVKAGSIARRVWSRQKPLLRYCEEWSQLDLLVICAGKSVCRMERSESDMIMRHYYRPLTVM